MNRGKRSRHRQLVPILVGLLILALGAALATVWREPLLGIYVRPERLELLITRLGLAGPLAIIVLQAVQVVLAPVPGQVLGLVSGYLFGPWLGALYSMVGLLLGTLLALRIVRRWGRPLVERLVKPPTLARIDHLSSRLGVPLLFLVFLLPFLPDDAVLLVAALADIPTAGVVLAALLGRLPGVVVAAWLGAGATGLKPIEWAAIVGVTILVAAPIYYWRSSLERLTWALITRLTGRHRNDVPDD